MKTLRIGMVGTFDVANFGDLLFPLVVRDELARRLGPVEIRPFSYHTRSAPSWPFDVSPLERLANELPSLDLLLIGGGDIVRFDHRMAPNYRPGSQRIHHPTGFWLSPIFMAHAANVPVAWNAPGVPGPVPRWAWPLVRASVAVSAYVNVRDTASREILAPFAPDSPVEVVPDTGFGAAALLPDVPAASSGPPDGYLVVQSRPEWAHWLRRPPGTSPGGAHSAQVRPWNLVLTPVGPALGDLVRPPGKLPTRTTFRPPLDPYQLLALIARSGGVVGTSLHLTIAALALGRPALRPASPDFRKYRMLEGLAGVRDLDPRAANGLDGAAALGAPDPAQLADIRRRLTRHWDTLADLAGGTSSLPRQSGDVPRLLMDLWERLPGALERRSTADDLRGMIQAARRRLARYRYNR